jgi:hypothetical protein
VDGSQAMMDETPALELVARLTVRVAAPVEVGPVGAA